MNLDDEVTVTTEWLINHMSSVYMEGFDVCLHIVNEQIKNLKLDNIDARFKVDLVLVSLQQVKPQIEEKCLKHMKEKVNEI